MVCLNEVPDNFFETKVLAIDLETTCYGEDPDSHNDRVLLVSMFNGRDCVVAEPGAWLSDLFAVIPYVTLFAHNAKFDLKFLKSLGLTEDPAKVWDTMVVDQVLSQGLRDPADLASTIWRRCGTILDKSLQKSFMSHSGEFTQNQIDYAMRDSIHLIKAARAQRKAAKEEGLTYVVNLENQLVPVVASMEWDGVGFSLDKWNRLVKEETDLACRAEQRSLLAFGLKEYTLDLFSPIGIGGINLSSPLQLKKALVSMGIDVPDTQERTLRDYLKGHPEAKVLSDIIDYKKAVKRIGFAYHTRVNSATGRIHTSYSQTRTRTGRFGSSEPNLQQVPRNQAYRDLFVAADGCKMGTADYAQQEMRILAHMSGDEELKRVCMESDVHLANARLFYQDPTIQKNDVRRSYSKNAGFAMAYGASPETVAATVRIPLEHARVVVEQSRELYKGVEKWANAQRKQAERYGWVSTLSGRKRRFTDDTDKSLATRARNTPIQGTAGDMLKLGMVYLYDALRRGGYKSRLVLTVHDELVVEIPERELDTVSDMISKEMSRAGAEFIPDIPMPVEIVVADSWSK